MFENVTHKCLIKSILASTLLIPEVSDATPLLKSRARISNDLQEILLFPNSTLTFQELLSPRNVEVLYKNGYFSSYWLADHSLSLIASVLFLDQICTVCIGLQVLLSSMQSLVKSGRLEHRLPSCSSNPSLSCTLQVEKKEKCCKREHLTPYYITYVFLLLFYHKTGLAWHLIFSSF